MSSGFISITQTYRVLFILFISAFLLSIALWADREEKRAGLFFSFHWWRLANTKMKASLKTQQFVSGLHTPASPKRLLTKMLNSELTHISSFLTSQYGIWSLQHEDFLGSFPFSTLLGLPSWEPGCMISTSPLHAMSLSSCSTVDQSNVENTGKRFSRLGTLRSLLIPVVSVHSLD